MWLDGLLMEKKGQKFRSVDVGALQKSASQWGDATDVETLARFNGS